MKIETITQALGKRLREARIKSGMTQKEMAARIGVGLNTMGNMENGFANIAIETWIKASQILGIDIGWSDLFTLPVDPFEEYDQRIKKKNSIKTRVRKPRGHHAGE